MTSTQVPGAATVTAGELISTSPATGDEVGRHPVADAAAVRAAVDEARDAAAWWAALGFAGRKRRLLDWRTLIARRLEELIELLTAENGKTHDDALLEVVAALTHIDWSAKKAASVLGPRRVGTGPLMANQAASVEYAPLGVVGVIGPWNYPVFTPLGSITYALAAGNAVVFKPSEYTPTVAAWLTATFAEVVPEHPVFSAVYGLADTGVALCRSGVDKIAFTGSTRTGRAVMAECAKTLTPVLIECGGKDAFIVDADADVPAAAEAALFGGMTNAGQTCVGVERVYVVTDVYDSFVDALRTEVGRLRDDQLGPITMPSQVDVIRRHIDDALARGGRALVGGPDAVRPPYVRPTVLLDVPEDSAAVQEETFGPTLTVTRVDDADEAVRLANATAYGLSTTVFSRQRGVELARKVRSGMASVNGVLAFPGVAALPFGGVGASGFGRIHGADGLREFTRPKSIARQRFRLPLQIFTFRRTEKANRQLTTLARVLYGRPWRRSRGEHTPERPAS